MDVIFVCNKLLLRANNKIFNSSLGLDVDQQELLYSVLALLILAVGRNLERSEMTANPYYTADTKLSAQLQLHPFVYNSPPIPPFSKFHPLVSRIHPKGCMCTPVEKHWYRALYSHNYHHNRYHRTTLEATCHLRNRMGRVPNIMGVLTLFQHPFLLVSSQSHIYAECSHVVLVISRILFSF